MHAPPPGRFFERAIRVRFELPGISFVPFAGEVPCGVGPRSCRVSGRLFDSGSTRSSRISIVSLQTLPGTHRTEFREMVKALHRAGGEDRAPRFRLLTRRVLRPDREEIRANPRARSAKLRAMERIA